MSQIIVTFHTSDDTFEFEEIDLNETYCDIVAKLSLDMDVMPLENFSYGLTIENGEDIILSEQWGAVVGTIFESTDQSLIETHRTFLPEDEVLCLTVWFENFGRRWEGSYTFKTPSSGVEVENESD